MITTSIWICAHLSLHGTSHGKLLIWLNLGCKGTHGGRLWNCNLSELHFSSLISLLAFLERLCLFSTKRPILSSLAAREDPQKESFNLEKNFFGERQFLHYPLHWLRFLCRNTCWKVYFISGFKPSFPQARTGSQCIVPVSHGLWSTGGHFETSSSYCGVKNIARKAFRLFNLSMWRHW